MAESDPRGAMDYPRLDDSLWIIWHSNDFKWPDGRRETWYLTNKRFDIMRDYALFDGRCEIAAAFPTKVEAVLWLNDQERKRGFPYAVTISTVGAMKKDRGFA